MWLILSSFRYPAETDFYNENSKYCTLLESGKILNQSFTFSDSDFYSDTGTLKVDIEREDHSVFSKEIVIHYFPKTIKTDVEELVVDLANKQIFTPYKTA